MELKEFLCGMACEFTFADLGQPEDYGFTTWAELFQYAVQNDIDELVRLVGEVVELAEERENIAGSLLCWRTSIEYVVNMYNKNVVGVAK